MLSFVLMLSVCSHPFNYPVKKSNILPFLMRNRAFRSFSELSKVVSYEQVEKQYSDSVGKPPSYERIKCLPKSERLTREMWEAVNFQPWTQRKSRSIREFNRQNSLSPNERYYSPSKGCAERQILLLETTKGELGSQIMQGKEHYDSTVSSDMPQASAGEKALSYSQPLSAERTSLIQKSNPSSKDKDWPVGTSWWSNG